MEIRVLDQGTCSTSEAIEAISNRKYMCVSDHSYSRGGAYGGRLRACFPYLTMELMKYLIARYELFF